MAEEYERTVSGLLKKRSEMLGEMHLLREQLASLANDISSLDRVLQAFGYAEDLEALPATKTRLVLFHKNELQQHLLYELRQAQAPLSSRELSVRLVTAEGKNSYDKRLILDVIKRVSKALGTLRRRGHIWGGRDEKGRYVWRPTAGKSGNSDKS